jgi:hypothetical protein
MFSLSLLSRSFLFQDNNQMIATYMLEYYRPLKQKPQQATMLRTQDDHNKRKQSVRSKRSLV